MKRITLAAAVVALMASSTAFAADSNGATDMDSMSCNDMMMKAKPMAMGMDDMDKKKMMMREMKMAKTEMKMGDEDACKMHMHHMMNSMGPM